MFRRLARVALALGLVLGFFSAPGLAGQPESNGSTFSPYAGVEHPTRAFWGDTHHHTANSGDAFMGGNRLTPEDAYRFARGEEVVSSSGVPAKLARPLDFLVISDHAEGLGSMFEVYNGNPLFMEDETLVRWRKAMQAGGAEAAAVTREVVSAQASGTLPKPVTDPKIAGGIFKSVWTAYTATAEKFNEPGRFTAMIGYEWTSVPGGNNLHRNVLFRDGKDPDFDASQPAFYYARVIEIPTPRWTAYDALRFGVKMSEDVPMDHQERGWTSPIWYAPPE